ncbi:MAG: hypothetical protein M0Z43_13640 [Acidithiobacillus sp.]|nr:hypothetical protein [Acidithiobacillus sp.]
MTETQAEYKTLAIEKWEEKAESCPCKGRIKELCKIGQFTKNYECKYEYCPFVHWMPEYR